MLEGNLLRFVRARAHACAHARALITQISCAIGMRNAKLRNYFNFHLLLFCLAIILPLVESCLEIAP